MAERARNLKCYILQMSKFMTPPLYTSKGLENQLKNIGFQAHDLVCGCSKPSEHLEYIFSTTCHRTEEDYSTKTTGDQDAVDGLSPGELEKLFSEDATEDDSG
nr:MAG: hypothetical protein [Betatorquevirus sp.]